MSIDVGAEYGPAPGERVVRRGRCRLRTEAPPHWWEGWLSLTNRRLFFAPDVVNPLQDEVSFSLRELTLAEGAGRNRLCVAAATAAACFQLLGSRAGIRGIAGRRQTGWLRDIAALRESIAKDSVAEGTRRAVG